MKCPTCHNPIPKQRMGQPRKHCSAECGEFARALARVKRGLPNIVAKAKPSGLVELRYGLFTLIADGVPRVRDPLGRFVGRAG